MTQLMTAHVFFPTSPCGVLVFWWQPAASAPPPPPPPPPPAPSPHDHIGIAQHIFITHPCMIIFACLIHMIMYHHITLPKTSSSHMYHHSSIFITHPCMIIFACLIHMIMYHHITLLKTSSSHMYHHSSSHLHDHVSSQLKTSSSHMWQARYLEPPERVAARLVAVGRGSCLRGRRSTWSLQKGLQRLVAVGRGSCLCGLRRAWSPWAAAPAWSLGAPGRRGPRLRLCGWRSTWSLQKGLRRAWSPWAARRAWSAGPRLLSVWQAQQKGFQALWAAAPVCVAGAGAVLGASKVAVGRGSCLCGRRSTWSLQKGLRRTWWPWAAAAVCVAVLGASRMCGRRSTWSVQKGLRRAGSRPRGRRSIWRCDNFAFMASWRAGLPGRRVWRCHLCQLVVVPIGDANILR